MRSGAVIRLIDVVLNLLFGFICISEVSLRSEVDLPVTQQIPLTNPDKEHVLYIGIMPAGDYLVSEDQSPITDLEQLRDFINHQKIEQAKKKMIIKVRIRSHRDAPAKYTVALAIICDELEVIKSIDVQRKKL